MLIVRSFFHWPPYHHWQERNGGLVRNTSDKDAPLLSLLEGLEEGGFPYCHTSGGTVEKMPGKILNMSKKCLVIFEIC